MLANFTTNEENARPHHLRQTLQPFFPLRNLAEFSGCFLPPGSPPPWPRARHLGGAPAAPRCPQLSTVEFLFGLADCVVPLGSARAADLALGPAPPAARRAASPYGNRLAWEALHLLRQLYAASPPQCGPQYTTHRRQGGPLTPPSGGCCTQKPVGVQPRKLPGSPELPHLSS